MTNKNTSSQNKNIAESDEYKALLSQYNIQRERIIELEDIVKKAMQTDPAIGFQKATEMQRESNEKATSNNSIEFPANLLAKFFLAARNVKQQVKLTLNSNNVVESWIIE
jgi:hypothetical protein